MKNTLFQICSSLGFAVFTLHAEMIVIEPTPPQNFPAPPFAQLKTEAQEGPKTTAVRRAAAHIVKGQLDQALAQLQSAALEQDGLLEEISTAAEFQPLRSDKRWDQLKSYLTAVEKAWPKSKYSRDVLTLPAGYDGKKALPVVLGLHGFGSVPEDFSGTDHQKICDDLGVAFLAVSGTVPLGRQSFMWSARYEDDWLHCQAALKRAEKHLRINDRQLVAIGFSQGGQLAADLCAAYPEKFRGCVVMSMGSRYASRLPDALATKSEGTAKQRYFFSWIQGEGESTKLRSRESIALLEQHHATVFRHEFPGKGHHFPRAYDDYFAIALQVILKP